jgi:hypothetical protein
LEADPADCERALRDYRAAAEEADQAEAVPDRRKESLAQAARSAEGMAERADPRSRTAGLITVLMDTDRSFQYLCRSLSDQGRPAWQESVRRLYAGGRIERDLQGQVTLQPPEGEPQDEIARAAAEVLLKRDEGTSRKATLRCIFVREERLWRLRNIELVFANDADEEE